MAWWPRRARWAVLALALAVATTGVTAAVVLGGPVLAPTRGSQAAATALRPFDGCNQLRQWYAQAAREEVTAWGLGPPIYPYLMVGDFGVATPTAARADNGEAADAVGTGATGTNVQEAGVDEPDLAKTDGSLVVLLDGPDLVVVDAAGDEPEELARLALPAGTHAHDLLLVDDRVVVLGSGHLRDGTRRVGWFVPPYTAQDAYTTLTTVDIADPADPQLVGTEQMTGELVSARQHDGVVRVVLSTTPDLPFVTPGHGRTHHEALVANRQLVRESPPRAWLPARTTSGGDLAEGINRDDVTRLLPCSAVQHPETSAGLGTLSVLTVDPQAPEDRAATGLTADGSLVYASTDRLYVATTEGGWDDWGRDLTDTGGTATSTEVHAFDVAGDTTTYVASGEVPGAVPDQWAFSEHEGLLRVATMRGSTWSPSETQVIVLEETDGELVEVGSVGGMGRHETIRAVRWFGDVAVIVTFRQVDPLYTLDLSDPTDPQLVGELKIPGFSEYLHPVGDGLLLGIGQDASRSGITQGAQVSTFDVRDLAAPERLSTLDLHAYQASVETDSRAFGYLPDLRLALVSTYGGNGGAGLSVVRIGSDGALSLADSLTGLPGRADRVRALPLSDGRVAVVAGGGVTEVMALPTD